MKRILSITICIATLLTLSSCANKYASEEVSTETVENKFTNCTFDSSISPYCMNDNHMIAVAENGYYFLRDSTISSTSTTGSRVPGKFIYYYDINSGTVTPLCSKIGCTHTDKNCDAYFNNFSKPGIGQSSDTSGFVYYDKKLYMIAYDSKNGTSLISYNRQGIERKEEMKLYDDPNYVPRVGQKNDFCIFNGYVYYWLVMYDNNDLLAKNRLYRMKLDGSGEQKLLLSNDETKEQNASSAGLGDKPMGGMYPTNNEIYFMNCKYNTSDGTVIYEIYGCHKNSDSELKLLLQTECGNNGSGRTLEDNQMDLYYVCMDNNNNMYYIDSFDDVNILYQYNFSTGVKSKIYEDHSAPNNSYIGFSCDDQNVYLSIKGTSEKVGSKLVVKNETKLVFLSNNGTVKYEREVKHSEASVSSGSSGVEDASIVGCDDRYVIIRIDGTSDFSFNRIVTKMSGSSTMQYNEMTDTRKYAVLEKSSIGTGKEEWIEMYNGMNIQ